MDNNGPKDSFMWAGIVLVVIFSLSYLVHVLVQV